MIVTIKLKLFLIFSKIPLEYKNFNWNKKHNQDKKYQVDKGIITTYFDTLDVVEDMSSQTDEKLLLGLKIYMLR